jgi:hypothetical protein
MIERRVRDFRLDPGLQRDCEKDILNMCAWFEVRRPACEDLWETSSF